ncbi:hypothetical protein YPPY05_3109, partial [Yersinia pestis PY-05]
MNGED